MADIERPGCGPSGMTEALAEASLGMTGQQYAALRSALAGVELTAGERGFLAWLSAWDQPTVEVAAGLLARLAQKGAGRG